jgi:hypothetical protein
MKHNFPRRKEGESSTQPQKGDKKVPLIVEEACKRLTCLTG